MTPLLNMRCYSVKVSWIMEVWRNALVPWRLLFAHNLTKKKVKHQSSNQVSSLSDNFKMFETYDVVTHGHTSLIGRELDTYIRVVYGKVWS